MMTMCVVVLQNNCIHCMWSCRCSMGNAFITINMLDCKCDVVCCLHIVSITVSDVLQLKLV